MGDKGLFDLRTAPLQLLLTIITSVMSMADDKTDVSVKILSACSILYGFMNLVRVLVGYQIAKLYTLTLKRKTGDVIKVVIKARKTAALFIHRRVIILLTSFCNAL